MNDDKNATPSSPVPPTARPRRSKITIYLASAIIVFILVGIFYYISSVNTVPKVTTTLATTIQSASSKSLSLFTSALTLPTNLQHAGTYNGTSYYCGISADGASILYSQPKFNLSVTNFSKLNHDIPFFVYISVFGVNSSEIRNLSMALNKSNGYCPDTAILTNSTHSVSEASFAGNPGYVWSLSNFTDTGLAISGINYTPGLRPNVTWAFTSTLYKNYDIRVGIWTFANHTNASTLARYTNLTIAAFKAEYGQSP